MDASGVVRILNNSMGPVQAITLRRAGSTDVVTRAAVMVGGAELVIGDVQQTGDKVMLTDRDIKKAGWVDDLHHGDWVIYSNGRVTIVQGRPEIFMMESDRVFVLRTLGG